MKRTNSPENWRKSSYSSGDGGNCLEVSDHLLAARAVVPVRDSKIVAEDAAVLTFSAPAWRAFIASLGPVAP
ncbi:DUF397 domain-containing protein [Streptomyces triticagri]|uniref:DUF397 domain-containing protein n=1 Tax=Streptomyces triticagri TaxID=2293568 RepID=A0A372M3W6_9ACTN|nr:DUF397 domain-containing protein [Streptomyces triticagri]RFU85581.1 DUF397 domain-containing protein [Streptomyces triticagri]